MRSLHENQVRLRDLTGTRIVHSMSETCEVVRMVQAHRAVNSSRIYDLHERVQDRLPVPSRASTEPATSRNEVRSSVWLIPPRPSCRK